MAVDWADRILAVRLWTEGLLETDKLPPRRSSLSGGGLPRVRAAPETSASRNALAVQVNVRLREWDYGRLVDVGRRYGLPPTTLARLFIVRGLEAAFAEDVSGHGDPARDDRASG